MSNLADLNLDVEEESKNVSDFSALPAGEYAVVITEAEMKDNKSGVGSHVSVTMEVIEGDCQGRLLWTNFNVKNSNDVAERIGRAELASCCKAIGISNPQDTDEMKNIPLGVRVALDRKDNTRNVIKKYYALEDAAPEAPLKAELAKQAPAPAPAPTRTAPPAVGARKPWKR